ncbi:MAG TPA: GIY-YIG nuclease family protein [Longimicrobiales bacterium]|nr:GIY-YIG nuclease family protein [Longimicrobiales bacterium]
MSGRGVTARNGDPRLLGCAASGTPMGRRLRRLRAQVRADAENRPGIYRMYDAEGALVYVGKSVRVRSRLLSYFRGRTSEKSAQVLRRTERIDWEPQPSEFAALLREMRLIREAQPPLNVQHRRDPGYSFVKVTPEAAPRLAVTTRVVADGGTYYGPLRGRAAVRRGTRELADLLGLRDCPPSTPTRYRDQAELFQLALYPECVRAELDRCLAPCARGCGEAEYRARVEEARAFLEGRSDAPLRNLEARMRGAAARMMFEHAALLRDRRERLRKLRDQLRILRRESRELSVVYRVPGFGGEDRVYLLVRGTIAEELPAPQDAAGEGRLRARVARLARQRLPPLHDFDAERLAELRLVLRWFERNPEERERLEPLRGSAPRGRLRAPSGAPKPAAALTASAGEAPRY